MDQAELDTLGAFPTRYRFKGNNEICVEWRDSRDRHDLWAVLEHGFCLNRKHEWEYEPQPSSRSDSFLKRCRFPFDEALRLGAAEALKANAKADAFNAAVDKLRAPDGSLRHLHADPKDT